MTGAKESERDTRNAPFLLLLRLVEGSTVRPNGMGIAMEEAIPMPTAI